MAWDFVVFLLSGALVCFVIWINQGILFQRETAPLFLLALFLFAFSSASGAYFLSFFFQSGTTIQAVMIAGGVVIPGLVGAFHAIQPSAYNEWLTWILLLIPHCAFAQVCFTIGFECRLSSQSPSYLQCPKLLSREYCMFPCIYMATESIVYFLIVVFMDALEYDPHLRGYLHRMRCLKVPRLPKKKAFMVLRRRRKASSDDAGIGAKPETNFMRVVRGKFGSIVEDAPAAVVAKDKDVTKDMQTKQDDYTPTLLSARDRVTSGRSLASGGVMSRRVSLGVNAERRRVQNLVQHFKSSGDSGRDRRRSDLKRRSSRTAVADSKRESMLVAQGISQWAIDSHNTIRYLPKVRCLRHAKRAINERSFFSVRTREVLGFVGLNGSGMSSMMNMLAGRNLPTQGTLWLEGVNLKSHPYHRFGKVGYCAQVDSSLESKMSGREILEMFGRISMINRTYLRRTVIPEALKLVGLKDLKNKPVEQYSQGDKRKLSFILSLMNGPRLILLDSPTSGVDVISRRRIWSVISQTKKELGRSVIIASPNPEECETLCDKIASLKHGRIQVIGDVPSVMSRLGCAYQVDINVCAYDTMILPAEDQSINNAFPGHDRAVRTRNNLLYLSLHKSCRTEILRQLADPSSQLTWSSVYKDHEFMAFPTRGTNPHSEPYSVTNRLEKGKGSRLARMISYLGDISSSLVQDRAERIIERILKELDKYYPGSELVEIQETRGRILIPKSPRRIYDLEESVEDSTDDEGEGDTSGVYCSETTSLQSPIMVPSREAVIEMPTTVNSTVPTTIPPDAMIEDDELSASDVGRVGSFDLRSALIRSRPADDKYTSDGNPLRPLQSSVVGESISQSTTDLSNDGRDLQRVPTIENVFRWFDKRRHVFHLMELRVSLVSIETHILLQAKRKSERLSKLEV